MWLVALACTPAVAVVVHLGAMVRICVAHKCDCFIVFCHFHMCVCAGTHAHANIELVVGWMTVAYEYDCLAYFPSIVISFRSVRRGRWVCVSVCHWRQPNGRYLLGSVFIIYATNIVNTQRQERCGQNVHINGDRIAQTVYPPTRELNFTDQNR